MDAGIFVIKERVCGFYRQPSTAVHCVPRIDRQVEDRIFKLTGIDQGIPQAARDDGFKLDLLTQGPPKHVIHVLD
ncbi:hypothetical protein D3C80_1978840 [compost metagenome]